MREIWLGFAPTVRASAAQLCWLSVSHFFNALGVSMNRTVMPHGTSRQGSLMPTHHLGRRSVGAMARKNEEDQELEARVRGHIRREMVERGLGVNEAGRKLGLGDGTLSRILNEERGFGSGFLLRVQRKLTIPSKLLLEEDPERVYMKVGVPDVEKH